MTPSDDNPPDRFAGRVADYVAARPSYPALAVSFVLQGLGHGHEGIEVADLGAGTGILTELLLERHARVWAIDPSEAMLEAARAKLGAHPWCTIVHGTAEATGLPDASMDAVTAGQAFHWFDVEGARREALRILRPGGGAALVWNTKQFASSPFLAGYEQLLRARAPEFEQVRHERVDDARIEAFFGAPVPAVEFDNAQALDWESLQRRVRSSSYTPPPGAPGHDALFAELRELFDEHAEGGTVTWPYVTVVHVGEVVRD
ncbi:MAG: class SAM-dependent methyltransferase [Thermoleophilia bacterium]|nr:class SAM-dependent methyltransferase [Thermoleophilia bacterium]